MTSRLTLLLASSILLNGCVVDLYGECSAPADCPDGTSCIDGLCLAPGFGSDGGPGPDGGDLTDGGPAGDGGSDVVTVSVRIVTPSDGALVGGSDLLVEVEARASRSLGFVRLSVTPEGGSARSFDAVAAGSDRYAVTLPLGGPGFGTGAYVLQASAASGTTSATSTPVSITLDRDPPAVSADVRYPTRAPGHLATGAFLRNETVVVEAAITDAPAGLALTPPVLRTAGIADVIGVSADGRWRFEFPARAPPFPHVTGTLAATIHAADTLGNTSAAPVSVALTRRAFSWVKPRAQPVTTAPALAGDSLLFGDESGHVYAIDRRTPPSSGTVSGTGAWEFNVGSAPLGHVTAGASRAYVVTRAGHVHALELDAAASERRAWTCPPLVPEQGHFDGIALTPAGGPSLVSTRITGSGGARDEETVLVLTRNRTIRAHRGTRFTSSFVGQPVTGCTKELNLGIGQPIEVGVPAVDAAGAIYVGTADGLVHKLRFDAGRQGSFDFESEWGLHPFNAGSAIAGPLALATAGTNGVAAILGATTTGRVFAIDGDARQLWSNTNAFDAAVRGGPVTANGEAIAVDQPSTNTGASDLRRLALSTGQASGDALSLPARFEVANASPVAGSDGRLYVASGPRLSATSSTGNIEWTFDTRPSASGPATSFLDEVTPQLACDGMLYLVENTTTSATIHALVTDSPSIATSGWPRASHDPRNTGHEATAACP